MILKRNKNKKIIKNTWVLLKKKLEKSDSLKIGCYNTFF